MTDLDTPVDRASQQEPHLGLLALLRAAIAGTDQDYTKVGLHRGILLLAVPMVLEMAMESVFSLADVFFVSRLGPDSVAAVGLAETLLIIIYSLGYGLGIPATALVARRIGEKRPEAAAQVVVQVNAIGLVLALALGAAGFLLAPALLTTMGASESVVATGSRYTALLLGSNVVIFLLFLNGAVLRGAGDAAKAMRALWIANGINLVLDPCLIFGLGPFPELGLFGAAVATTIGRGIGALYQVACLLRGSGHLQVGLRHLRLDAALIGTILRLSAGAVGQTLVETASWLLLVRFVAFFGSTVLAGYTIAMRVLMFALMPGWGLANAASTLVGQNLGAEQPGQAERSVWWCGLYNTGLLVLCGGSFILWNEQVLGLFTQDAGVIAAGADCLRITTYGIVVYGWGMVMLQAFNGAGDTTTPLWLNLASFWLVKLSLTYTLEQLLGWGANGIWIAVTVAYSFHAIVGMGLFRLGRWKRQIV